MTIERLNPATLSTPTGYTHVAIVSSGRQVHVSGQVALDAAGRLVGEGDLAAQTEQVYANLAAALTAAGSSLGAIVKTVIYVVGLTAERAAAVRTVRAKHFGDGPFPASTMVGVTALVQPGWLIEIDVIAALD